MYYHQIKRRILLNITSDMSLEESNNLGEPVITPFLKCTQNTSFEEDLSVTQSVVSVFKGKSSKDFVCGYLTINKSSWDCIWSQNGVSKIVQQ